MIDRREFLQQLAGGVGAVGLLSSPLTSVLAASTGAAPKPLYDISLAQWSLHKALFAGEMDNLDFAKRSKQEFGISAVEYVNQFFRDKAKDKKYLAEMKKRAEGEGVKSLLIMCDGEGRLGDPNKKARNKAVKNHYKWVDAANYLGCHSIRVNAASEGSYDEQMKLAIDGLRRLTKYGAKKNINVIVENHGGLSSNGKWLTGVIEAVDHPMCGTLPDFGNFRISQDEEYDRYQGIKELMPFAKGVSAKSHDFDAEGNEINTDFYRMMRIVLDSGFRGFVDVEYEGSELSEPDGIKATRDLLIKVREALSSEYS